MGTVVVRAIAVWVLLAVLAVANAAFRSAVLTPRLGEQGGHVASTATLCLLIVVVSWISLRWIGVTTAPRAYLLGLLWLGLTVTFEFLAGHYAFGNSWERLLSDYNLARGRVWVLVLVVTFFAPRLAVALRSLASGRR